MKFCPICKRNWDDEFRVCPIDGLALQSVTVDADPHSGQTVGQARVEDKIADGEMGPIYRAQDPLRGIIAIQFITPDRLSSPVLADAFEDAVKLAAKANHPAIVGVYSLEHTPDGQAAVLMEYVKGVTLVEYRQSHPSLDVHEACRIVREAGEGISAAHRISMMHGSLQPSRILIASDGKAKVAGFHRSGLRDDGSPLFRDESLIYMAPERTGLIQDIAIPDYRADIYSLGVILYELLTGKLPYEAKSVQELEAVMGVGPPLPPNFSNPQVSPTLSRVVLRAISKHPGDRHRSMEEFVRELDAALQPVGQAEKDDFARHATAEPPQSDWPGRKQAEDGSFFSWFKTRAGGRAKSKDADASRTGLEDSTYSRKKGFRMEDDGFEERTVLATGRKGRSRRQTFFDTFTRYRRNSDLSMTDALPPRDPSTRAYVWMAVAAVILIFGIAAWFWFFRGPATGKLRVESQPSGAQVYLGDDFLGPTPLAGTEVKAGAYRLRLQLDGYEAVTSDVEVTPNADIQRSFTLIPLKQMTVDETVLPPTSDTNPPPKTTGDITREDKQPFEAMANKAIAARSFFPPAPGNAWDILQVWKKRETAGPSPDWERVKQVMCKELESEGAEKLDQKDFQAVRSLLDQVQTHMSDQACTARLQARFESAISQSIAGLRESLNAAMNRQNYVTPEFDNALNYVRLILHIEPQNLEAKTLKGDIYTRALEQARVKSDARQHQDALDIYLQLKNNYPDAPSGLDAINKGIERENRKLQLLNTLKIPFSVQVKHGHSFFRVLNRECSGIFRVDGFTIEYQSTGDHSFKVAYDALKSVSFRKAKITLEGSTIADGKIELEQVDKNPIPSLEDVYKKIEEYRKLYAEYMHP